MRELERLLEAHRGSAAAGGADAAAPPPPLFDDATFRAGGYRDGTLLRFRGVVRDVQDPELVLLATEGDSEDSDAAATAAAVVERFEAGAQVGKEKVVERVPLKVALFPHRTPWAARAFDGDAQRQSPASASSAAGSGRAKRSNEAVDDEKPAVAAASTSTTESLTSESTSDALSKKPKAAVDEPADMHQEQQQQQQSKAPFLQNLISVYVYEGQYEGVPLDAFRVNEAFDFVGVLDLTVLGAARHMAAATADATDALSADELRRLQISECLDEIQQRQRSGAVVHCCDAVRVSPFHHVRPHAPRAFYAKLEESNAAKKKYCADEWAKLSGSDTGSALGAIRAQLVQHLATVALAGDVLAAEYLLLCLLSRVYSRPEAATPLGNLSLNLSLGNALPAEQVRGHVARIEAAIRALVPVCATVDLALESLNASAFAPHKDYETDAMVSGALQVPHGTVLFVKETLLSAGELSDQGVKNVGALQALVAKMLLPYDFQYYSMDFPQDVAVVSVSEGKSILPVTVIVPLVVATTEAQAAAAAEATEALLESFRVYIGVLRTLEISIGNEQAEAAEKHYVACRQAKQEVSLDDLHRWLRVARLVALSQGEDVVTKAAWDHMLALEAQRLERLHA